MAIFIANTASAECYGEGRYRICSNAYTAPNGESVVRSHDTDGNNYEIRSGVRKLPQGISEVYSKDSDGNSYNIQSWCDNVGCHSKDSEGNVCTVTHGGKFIGC
jgi:hypothetical protein